MADTLPTGYYWGPNLTKPGKLFYNGKGSLHSLTSGVYDAVTIPIGDNWSIADPSLCKYTTVNLATKSSLSFLPIFPVDEPSCGFLICVRGPYVEGTPEAQRGAWQINGMPSGMVGGRLSMPVYTHIGARTKRYAFNGFTWQGYGQYHAINSAYWGKNPVGPILMGSANRAEIKPSANGPDVTVLATLKAGRAYFSISRVDMFGRETELSDPLQLDLFDNTFVNLSLRYPHPMGTCGIYVYAGYTSDDMHRQPILNCESATPKYLWPVQSQQIFIHKIVQSNIRAVPPSLSGVASILNWPQKRIVDGGRYINYDKDSYDLYCPIILTYDSSKFGRRLGLDGKKCTFTHRNKYGDAQLMSDIPMVVFLNQRDELKSAKFVTDFAHCGVTFSDYNGGQAFSNAVTDCVFEMKGEDSYGLLVEDTSSVWGSAHTASEIRVKNTYFGATIPTKIEGNQTAKVRFNDMCVFNSSNRTKYKADTAGLIYCGTPNQITFNNVEGVSGVFRSMIGAASWAGPINITLSDFFVDQGCNVYITVCGFTGGKVNMLEGERINSWNTKWVRLIEAPSSLNMIVKCHDIMINNWVSAISYQLNQLSLDLDFPIKEVVCPTPESWQAKGMILEYPAPGATANSAYFDFRKKKLMNYTIGYSDVPDSIVSTVLPA